MYQAAAVESAERKERGGLDHLRTLIQNTNRKLMSIKDRLQYKYICVYKCVCVYVLI